MLDETHDVEVRSWVPSANGHPQFPLQNLPLGIFSPSGGGRRIGVAIGDMILDLSGCVRVGAINFGQSDHDAAEAVHSPRLNGLMGCGRATRRNLRRALFGALKEEAAAQNQIEEGQLLHHSSSCRMHLPAVVGDYTDFFAGIQHAVTAGRIFRPDAPLLPNYKYVPVGYHGRASTITASPTHVRRPISQVLPLGASTPILSPTKKLDYELELAIWIAQGNPDAEPVAIQDAEEQIFGVGLLNDWSARDFQRWEAQPLGPFLAKNFATTVSPWVITLEALLPFRVAPHPRPAGDPDPLSYLTGSQDRREGAIQADLAVLLSTLAMRQSGLGPVNISAASTLDLYWTPAQLIAHHSVNGCVLNPGDLFGSGTISAEGRDGAGCLLEMTFDGSRPITLPTGEIRTYLEDGDEVTFRALCQRDGFASIGFGENRGLVTPARVLA